MHLAARHPHDTIFPTGGAACSIRRAATCSLQRLHWTPAGPYLASQRRLPCSDSRFCAMALDRLCERIIILQVMSSNVLSCTQLRARRTEQRQLLTCASLGCLSGGSDNQLPTYTFLPIISTRGPWTLYASSLIATTILSRSMISLIVGQVSPARKMVKFDET